MGEWISKQQVKLKIHFRSTDSSILEPAFPRSINCWGQTELLAALNAGLEALIADGTLATLWSTWIPWKPFPFAAAAIPQTL